MNRFANFTEWLKDGRIIKVRSETITHPPHIDPLHVAPARESTIPVATVEEMTPEENAAIQKVNEADVDTLTTVKGIGPKTAQKILSAGPFTSFDHLAEQVKLRGNIFEALQAWADS